MAIYTKNKKNKARFLLPYCVSIHPITAPVVAVVIWEVYAPFRHWYPEWLLYRYLYYG
ncbi:hypothetical protein SAMN05421788_102308 [Filimonas lacunae]|uniref:Uncharacterized protein n=2 Tax=Filimonas lacunae TaxID=477680 RepID=A0A1N7NAV6_9BACT|nr:hypothetical protein SAMN05421788_102308 [Filimonas lacunae]